MQSPWDGDVQFRTHGDWNGVIGPDDVKVIAWDFWPDAYQEGDAYA